MDSSYLTRLFRRSSTSGTIWRAHGRAFGLTGDSWSLPELVSFNKAKNEVRPASSTNN